MDARNSGMANMPHRKKPYQSPKSREISISETALLIRRKTFGNEIQPGGAPLSDEVALPVLLVLGYVGDLNFIQPAVRAPARELEPFATRRGVGWLEMQFADAGLAEPQASFLLLDLRNRHRAARGFLELIGQDRNGTVPCVILVASSEQFLGWKGVDPKQCWQLRSCPTPEDLSKALHSFLLLCSIFSNWPANEHTELDPGRDHAFSGRADKE